MTNSNSWVRRSQPHPQAVLRLFCFPYAGGSAAIFRQWSNSLPESIEVCAVELPGRGTKFAETLFTDLEPLVTAIAPAIVPYLDKPFAFFGHSMGALISFELARFLRRQNLNPVHLFVSAYRAPQIPAPAPPIHTLPEARFLEKLRRFNGTPRAVLENPELLQLILPILRADFAVLETYIHIKELPLDCPITVFGGLQDLEVTPANLEAWQEQTKAACSLQMLPGNHFFLDSARSLLLQKLSGQLSQLASVTDQIPQAKQP